MPPPVPVDDEPHWEFENYMYTRASELAPSRADTYKRRESIGKEALF